MGRLFFEKVHEIYPHAQKCGFRNHGNLPIYEAEGSRDKGSGTRLPFTASVF